MSITLWPVCALRMPGDPADPVIDNCCQPELTHSVTVCMPVHMMADWIAVP